jgi:hypothetical protein
VLKSLATNARATIFLQGKKNLSALQNYRAMAANMKLMLPKFKITSQKKKLI